MKLKFLLFLGLVTGFGLIAPQVNGQAVKRGNLITDAYYGAPNFMSFLLRVIAEDYSSDPNLEVLSLGPMGNRTQFMVTNKIGVGWDVFYAHSGFRYTNPATDPQGNPTSYTYELINTRPRFLARMDVHLGENKMFDPYFAFGLGYSAIRYKFTTDDPTFDQDIYDIRSFLPIAYRAALGFKVYFVKFMGAGAEFGLGGPLITFGLCAKFGLIPSL